MEYREIPFFKPYITDAEIKEVEDTLRSGWLTLGPKTKAFEKMLADFLGVKDIVALNSGTAALHLSLVALDIKEGDEVITTPYTFVSTVAVIIQSGAKPVFVDIEPSTMNIDVSLIEEKITERTKAIMPVHIAGQPCDMDEITEIARKYKLFVLEDAAHALPAYYKGKVIGTIGHTTSFSFYATKNLVTGEGGALATDDVDLAEKIRALSLHGISKDAWKRYTSSGSWYYEVIHLGFKYNFTDIQASLGIVQLQRLQEMQKMRRHVAEMYYNMLSDIEEIELPFVKEDRETAWHLFIIKLNLHKLNIGRNEFIDRLSEKGVKTSVHFIPVHYHPYYQKMGYRKGMYPMAEAVYRRSISLPFYPQMTEDDVRYVANSIKDIISKERLKV